MQNPPVSPILIFLVGARASGKTTVGRALARRLGLPFVDTDAAVTSAAGKTVAAIVAAKGWPAFRQQESAALRATVAKYPQGAVIATGGGMVLAVENRRFMRERGVVFYLEATAPLLVARLTSSPLASQRPSLTGKGVAAEMKQVLAHRAPLYLEAAHHRLDAALPLEHLCEAATALLPPAAE